MKKLSPLLSFVLLLFFAACSTFEPNSSIAISDVNIVDVTDGKIKPNQTVIISGNQIAEVGPSESFSIPDEATVINGKGKYLIPGLWDMHTHVMSSIKDVMPFNNLFLANGITGIRGLGDSNRSLAGMTKPAIQSGEMTGPVRMVISAEIVGGTYPKPHHLFTNTAEQGIAIVDSLVGAGAPFIKVYNTLNRDTYFAITKRTGELGVPLAGHVPISIHAREASDAGQRSIEHLISGILQSCSALEEEDYRDIDRLLSQKPSPAAKKKRDSLRISVRSAPFSEERCKNTLQHLSKNNTWVVPTHLANWTSFSTNDSLLNNDSRQKYISDGLSTYWYQSLEAFKKLKPTLASWYDNMHTIAGMMEEYNVAILIGTDTPAVHMLFPGFSMHDEMELLVEAGLSPLYVLQGATVNPAKYFDRTDSLGTVEKGKLADLVLLNGNPLEDIRNTKRIQAVVANGHIYNRNDLDSLLTATETVSAQRSLASMLSETLEKQDFDAVEEQYLALKESAPDTVAFNMWELADLGYSLLGEKKLEEAFTIFEWNIDTYPNSPYPLGMYADALFKAGNPTDANSRYQEAMEIAQARDHPSLGYFQSQKDRLDEYVAAH